MGQKACTARRGSVKEHSEQGLIRSDNLEGWEGEWGEGQRGELVGELGPGVRGFADLESHRQKKSIRGI